MLRLRRCARGGRATLGARSERGCKGGFDFFHFCFILIYGLFGLKFWAWGELWRSAA